MPFRIAAYNVENLFSRPRAMNQPEGVAATVLNAHARLNELFEHETYSAADKAEMLGLLGELHLLTDDGDVTDSNTMAVLRKYRGQLLRRPREGGAAAVTVVADGRNDWTGWVDLTRERIIARAIENTARVIREVDADIVGVVEAEDRITLKRFSDTLLTTGSGDGEQPIYPHVMVIDGNDARGIDVGVLSKADYPIERIRSHVDDGGFGRTIFSRDCPEYWFTFPEGSALAGESLVVLVNHLKSKFGGNDPTSVEKRRRQAEQVKLIYNGLRSDGVEHVVVLGDFNDTPDSGPLQALLAPLPEGTDLTDFVRVADFDDGAPDDDRPGTFGNGTRSQKIDYLLMSPALFERATSAAIFRKGVWGGTHGTLFPHFDTIENETQAASDHAAVVVEIDID